MLILSKNCVSSYNFNTNIKVTMLIILTMVLVMVNHGGGIILIVMEQVVTLIMMMMILAINYINIKQLGFNLLWHLCVTVTDTCR